MPYSPKSIYGGTVRLFHEVLNNLGVESSFVDTANPAAVRAAIRPNTKILVHRDSGNPTMTLTDLAEMSAIAREHHLLHAVDNTFLTPLLQKPFDLGADISVLSTTKYVDGKTPPWVAHWPPRMRLCWSASA